MVRVLNVQTGHYREFKNAEMMVASNGTIFVKQSNKTVFATSSPDFVVEYVDK